MSESSSENGTGPSPFLTNQSSQTPLHPSNRPNRTPAMKAGKVVSRLYDQQLVFGSIGPKVRVCRQQQQQPLFTLFWQERRKEKKKTNIGNKTVEDL